MMNKLTKQYYAVKIFDKEKVGNYVFIYICLYVFRWLVLMWVIDEGGCGNWWWWGLWGGENDIL